MPATVADSRTVHDPFLNQDVQVSNKLTDRLRGRYANGPTAPNGEPEFGWREFPTPPVQHEAAAEIERLNLALAHAGDRAEAADAKAMDLQEQVRHLEHNLANIIRTG